MRRTGTCAAIFAPATLVMTLLIGPGASAEPAQHGRYVTEAEAVEWHPEMRKAFEYAEDRAGEVSFSVFDAKGRHYERGGYRTSNMASTAKVMLMAAYLRRNSVEDRSLTSYEESLIEPMIRRSDNGAAETIDNILGRDPLVRLARDAGMKSYGWNPRWGLSRTSARDQALFMRKLGKLLPDRHRDYALRQLTKVKPSQRWGIGKVKLNGWSLRFKGGWGIESARRSTKRGGGTVNHQVALLQKDGYRIGLAVLTENNPSHSYGKATLEGVFEKLLKELPR